jgi:membrane protease YdiL (CAAX protease family)
MLRSLSNWQKDVIFYVLTLIMALAVVIFGPDREGPLQILNMLTPTVGVLLLLLVVTPTAILCVSYGVAWLVGVLSWNFESDVLLNLIIAIMINSVFAIFEEIGWRGYLLPHFGAPGSFGAALLVGFLHGVWHLP